MADDTRIGSGRSGGAGIDLIKQGLGLGVTTTRDSSVAPASPAAGVRGQRILSPDTPPESLDRNARRGTYLDILV